MSVVVEHPATHIASSAGRVKKVEELGEGRRRTVFTETHPISVYLLAINIHDMDKV